MKVLLIVSGRAKALTVLNLIPLAIRYLGLGCDLSLGFTSALSSTEALPLALVVNNFTNVVSAALTGLKTILAGSLEEKQHFGELFEYPEYYETALLLTQLFYAKRNEDSESLDLNAPLTGRSLTSAWQKDANAIDISLT